MLSDDLSIDEDDLSIDEDDLSIDELGLFDEEEKWINDEGLSFLKNNTSFKFWEYEEEDIC